MKQPQAHLTNNNQTKLQATVPRDHVVEADRRFVKRRPGLIVSYIKGTTTTKLFSRWLAAERLIGQPVALSFRNRLEPVEPWHPSKMDLAQKLFSHRAKGVISVEQHKAPTSLS
jgi:hypothetical protein